jgi:hypothetical protein
MFAYDSHCTEGFLISKLDLRFESVNKSVIL